MSKKISELTEAVQANNNDLIMIVQNGVNKKITADKIGTGQGGGDTLPIGTIMPYTSDTIPNGWLLCDGSAVSRATYSELFDLIGTTYGTGDGNTTFNLPNLKGKVAVGKDGNDTDFNALGKTGGEKEHTLTVSEMPKHNHTGGILTTNTIAGNARYYFQQLGATNDENFSNSLKIGEAGGNQPHNNLQPYLVTNYIIKAKMTVAIEGEIIQENDTATTENVYSASAINNKIKTNIVTGQEFATNEYIDNKQVFLTAFKFTSLLDSMVINSNIDYIKAIHCNIKDNSSGNWRTIPWIYNSSTYDSSFAGGIYVSSSGAIGFQAGTGLANISKGYVEVYYTKN